MLKNCVKVLIEKLLKKKLFLDSGIVKPIVI